MNITIYTDGSYSPQHNIGAWAAMIFIDDGKVILSGIEKDTTHNRMELMAIIKSIDCLLNAAISFKTITIITDSQYAAKLPDRKSKLLSTNLRTRKGNDLRNADLVKILFDYMERFDLKFEKIKAHQKETGEVNYNREVDKLVRGLLRGQVDKI